MPKRYGRFTRPPSEIKNKKNQNDDSVKGFLIDWSIVFDKHIKQIDFYLPRYIYIEKQKILLLGVSDTFNLKKNNEDFNFTYNYDKLVHDVMPEHVKKHVKKYRSIWLRKCKRKPIEVPQDNSSISEPIEISLSFISAINTV
jgi:hypothetical protein